MKIKANVNLLVYGLLSLLCGFLLSQQRSGISAVVAGIIWVFVSYYFNNVFIKLGGNKNVQEKRTD